MSRQYNVELRAARELQEALTPIVGAGIRKQFVHGVKVTKNSLPSGKSPKAPFRHSGGRSNASQRVGAR